MATVATDIRGPWHDDDRVILTLKGAGVETLSAEEERVARELFAADADLESVTFKSGRTIPREPAELRPDSPCADCTHPYALHGHFGECAALLEHVSRQSQRCDCPGWVGPDER